MRNNEQNVVLGKELLMTDLFDVVPPQFGCDREQPSAYCRDHALVFRLFVSAGSTPEPWKAFRYCTPYM